MAMLDRVPKVLDKRKKGRVVDKGVGKTMNRFGNRSGEVLDVKDGRFMREGISWSKNYLDWWKRRFYDWKEVFKKLLEQIAYIDVPTYPPAAPPVQTPPSLEWSSGSLHISPAPSIVPSPISSPMIPLTIPSLVASPATAKTGGFLTELGAQAEMQGGLICDHTE
ncbi:hypothetical protein Tco_1304277 [Tanacetum coccineum]